MARRPQGPGSSRSGADLSSGTRYRQLAETQLAILNALPARVALVDRDGTIVAANESWQRVAAGNGGPGTGFNVGCNYLDLCERMPEPAGRVAHRAAAALREILAGERSDFSLEYAGQWAAPPSWFRLTITPARGAAVDGALITHLDITEVKVAELRARHLGRLYAVSSAINEAIVRIRDPVGLCQEACRIVVESGGLLMAWVGLADAATGQLQPVARWGRDEGYVDEIRIYATTDHPGGVGPAGEAFRTGRPAACNDIGKAGDSFATRDAALARGYLSCATFPLLVEDRPVGVLAVYGAERDYFDGEVMELLVALAGDLSFAMEAAAKEARRQEAEAALRISEARLVAAQAVAKVGSWETDLATLQVVWSEETHRIFETDPATFRPSHADFLARVHPEDRDRVDQAFRSSLDQHTTCASEHRIVMGDGRVKVVDERWRTFRDEAGRPVRALGTCQDITERKRIEEALRASEERFRQLAENITQVFWITDPAKDQMIYVSPAYARIWGRSCESLYQAPRTWLDAIHPEDRERVALAARTKQALSAYDETYRIIRPDGTQRWVRDRAFPVRNQAGQVYRIVGIAVDVTERVETEEKLAQQAALLDKARDAILVVNLERRITFWNPGAERLYGVPAAEAMGRDIGELVTSEQGVGRQAMAVIQEQGEWTGELRQITRAGQKLVVECHWSLIRGEQGQPRAVLAINTDVTAKRQLETEFLRVQRMESIGTLAGGIAHDLNNVLAPIMMAVETLEDHVADPEGRSILRTLGDAAQRGADLVRQVLTFARGVDGQRLPVDVLEVFRGIERIVGTTFPKNIRFELGTRGAPAVVLGDSTQLHQVFMNLLVNARDALPNGGRIAVRVEPVRVDDTLGGLNPEARPGDYVLVEVADSGIGISAEARERIFDPFYTTKELGKGTGLGLSTTLAIVRSHGGFIRVQSEPGQGSVFQVYLPAGTPAEPGTRGAAAMPQPRGQGELILVVDDEDAIRRILSRILERHGYRVVTAAHGAEAASIYARRRDEIALVLTDMAMPIMDGPTLVLALRAINPAVRIIGSSGLSGQAGEPGKPVAGLEHFVAKPYTADGLLAIVRKVLDGE